MTYAREDKIGLAMITFTLVIGMAMYGQMVDKAYTTKMGCANQQGGLTTAHWERC